MINWREWVCSLNNINNYNFLVVMNPDNLILQIAMILSHVKKMLERHLSQKEMYLSLSAEIWE